MIFTTTKKKEIQQEKYPDLAVMTLVGRTSGEKGAKVAFHLNSMAMKLMGFPLNTPNVSKIANGFDENNNLVLAAIDTGDMYTSNVTAKNTFNSQKLFERINSQWEDINENEFILQGFEEDGVKYASMTPMCFMPIIDNPVAVDLGDSTGIPITYTHTITSTEIDEIANTSVTKEALTQNLW